MEIQVRNDDGEILNSKEVTEDQIDRMRYAIVKINRRHVTEDILKTADDWDEILSDLEPCPHDGETYVDEGGWEYCAECDDLLPAELE